MAAIAFGRLGVFVEERLRGDEKAGGADPALESGAFEEALLQRMQALRRGEALDGFDFRPFNLGSEDEARVDQTPVHDDVARAAVAVVATFFRSGEMERVAEHVEQALPGFAEELGRFVVDRAGDMDFLAHDNILGRY